MPYLIADNARLILHPLIGYPAIIGGIGDGVIRIYFWAA